MGAIITKKRRYTSIKKQSVFFIQPHASSKPKIDERKLRAEATSSGSRIDLSLLLSNHLRDDLRYSLRTLSSRDYQLPRLYLKSKLKMPPIVRLLLRII
ncbi:hypothetical protein TSAR_002485 [Trichomalopsis sarcophagae]|uniref:Uncharacterized protein n=1 Tax=Trichomalopsis sarcophagae TaxID=543379 RepID=A0A232F9D7_9HYME|nr:hypothetical protein TSAR_002485 [Trichomalopsis sarcophagae]